MTSLCNIVLKSLLYQEVRVYFFVWISYGHCLDVTFLIKLLNICVTLYSPRVTRSKIVQTQLQTENIDPINNNMVRLNNTQYSH